MKDLTAVIMATEPNGSRAEYQRRREAFCLDKVKWSADEFDALAARYTAAAAKFRNAVETRSFAQLRSAYLDLSDIVDKTAFLNDGVMHAIEQVNPVETNR